MRIIWRWKANIEEYNGRPGVVGTSTTRWQREDGILLGRDGWVAYREDEHVVEKKEENSRSQIPRRPAPIAL